MTSLQTLVATPPSGRSRPLLLDHGPYTDTVIRQGQPLPALDIAELTGHVRQVHALLDPDVVWLDVEQLYRQRLSQAPELLQEMGKRARSGFALRTLLADEVALDHLQRAAATVTEAVRRPLLLDLPSPARWLSRSHTAAGTPLDLIDEDAADSASMYLAEWLGKLGSLPIALVLMDARPVEGDAPVELVETLAAYTSILNVAGHFGWSVAVRPATGIDARPGDPSIGLVPESFWTDGAAVPTDQVLLASLSRTALPERVLDQLAELR